MLLGRCEDDGVGKEAARLSSYLGTVYSLQWPTIPATGNNSRPMKNIYCPWCLQLWLHAKLGFEPRLEVDHGWALRNEATGCQQFNEDWIDGLLSWRKILGRFFNTVNMESD